MVPQRRPTISSPSARERDTFTWPPPTDEIDAIEVIVLDDPPATARQHAPRRSVDVAHWGLTLASLLAIGVALVLQFANWRVTPEAHGAPDATRAPSASSATALPIVTTPIEDRALSPSPTPPRPPRPLPASGREAVGRGQGGRPSSVAENWAPASIPARKARPRERQARLGIDSPPLRLPESYVQPRLISSGDGGRVRGKVVLGVQVRANGRVGAVDVLSEDGDGDRNLERAAVAAVKQWRYRPALRDGVPMPARLKVIVKFS